ncbi:HAD superfamily protein [Babesia gibsoni]|uniref:HAD superfamily protein n=1 Tax=Babesia gibsoni TaxID=33632 RepID=A0AAD8LQV8_BABGI|nr:HAD superfamily protein [Babesia gibsoni]
MGFLRYIFHGVASIIDVVYIVAAISLMYTMLKVIHWWWYGLKSSASDAKDRRPQGAYSLVLDLENTLIRAVCPEKGDSVSVVSILTSENNMDYVILTRPHLESFLKTMSKDYEIVLYSTSQQEDADAILKQANIDHLFERKLYRNSCMTGSDGVCIKDLKKVSSDMSKLVLIDNTSQASSYFKENSVPIDNWFGAGTDRALLDIIPFLQALRNVEDVRYILSLRWKEQRAHSIMVSPRVVNGEPPVPPLSLNLPPNHTRDLAEDDLDWDEIGQRLTSRVKHIINTTVREEGFHNKRNSPR